MKGGGTKEGRNRHSLLLTVLVAEIDRLSINTAIRAESVSINMFFHTPYSAHCGEGCISHP